MAEEGGVDRLGRTTPSTSMHSLDDGQRLLVGGIHGLVASIIQIGDNIHQIVTESAILCGRNDMTMLRGARS